MLRAFLEQASGQLVAALAGQLSELSLNGSGTPNGAAETPASAQEEAEAQPAEALKVLII